MMKLTHSCECITWPKYIIWV